MLKNKWKQLAVSQFTTNEATGEKAVEFFDEITSCSNRYEEEIVFQRFPEFIAWEPFLERAIGEDMAALADHAQDLENQDEHQ